MAKNKLLIAVFIFVFGFASIAAAQTKRKSKSRKAKPAPSVTVQTPPLEPEIVSTAAETEQSENDALDPQTGKPVNAAVSSAKSQNQTASGAAERQVNELKEKVNTLQKQQQDLLDLERLTRAEERAESLRKQLEDAAQREADLQRKAEQLDFQLRPENIERDTAVIGSTRPEEVRETRRKMLEAEKNRINELLNKASENRARLEAAVRNADALVEKLRARVETDSDNKKDDKPAQPQNQDNL
jgi:chromosome segregation ATPase